MKNESKAIGGKARALRLTSDRRKEIAQKAAEIRWKNHNKAEKESPKKIKGISNKKFLEICVLIRNKNIADIEIIENEKVIRKFNESSLEQAHAKIEGYVSALQDLGIQVQINVKNMEL